MDALSFLSTLDIHMFITDQFGETCINLQYECVEPSLEILKKTKQNLT